MGFYEIFDQVVDLLRRRGRVTYQALQREFQLDEAFLAALKEELIDAQRLAVDENGRILVWTGAPLAVTPPSSQSGVETGSLSPPEPPAVHGLPAPATAPAPDAERRQLTVLFCDLVGSTPLSERLDPEELREVIRAYQAACTEVIERFDGFIAQLLGDGLVVYFGWPRAHEDDARRAARAGLGMLEAVATLSTRLERDHGVRLAVRVGIHTGRVVVDTLGSGGREEQVAFGDTPNIAARLQALGAPNTVVISEATARLIEGYFTVADLGLQPLKGIAMPLQLYQVLQESGAQSRLDVATPRGLTPLVGREDEAALLLERWEQVKRGGGQVVVLSGEGGIGKSRLVRALKDRVVGESGMPIECRCSPYHQHSALYPMIDLIQRTLQWHPNDPPDARLHTLESALSRYRLASAEALPLLADLVSLALPAERYPPLTMTPQRQRQQTLEVLLAILLEQAARQPTLFLVEDLHWVDPSTLEFLHLLVDRVPTARVLAVFTCRPTFHPPWGSRADLTTLALSRLPHHQVEQMVGRLTGGKFLPVEVLHQIVTKTDGVPLFVEELTKMVLESGLLRETSGYELARPLPPLAIPATLQDSLMARLDYLGTAKGVAQLGATIGRHFSYELLRAVSQLDEATLQHELQRLVKAELLHQHGLVPAATYTFKHALIQETAAQSLLNRIRQQYHRQIAQVLAERFPETAETQPELLAYHYTEAGLTTQAIAYWQQAGQRAVERSANLEALDHLRQALELLATLPETPERTQQELAVQITHGPALMVIKGYAAPEVETAYMRAQELCQQLGETPQLFTVLRGLWGWYVARAELSAAYHLGEQCLALAQRAQSPAFFLWVHYALGLPLFHLGEFAAAREHFAQGLALYNPQKRRTPRALQDPGVAYLSFLADALWLLGYPDQALQTSQAALTLARTLAHPFSIAYAMNIAATLQHFHHNVPEVRALAEAGHALCMEQGISYWLAWGPLLQGWALVDQGQEEEGIALQQQGLIAYSATGSELVRPYFFALLAESYGKSGKPSEGLRVLSEALEVVEKTQERWWEAELHRLRGELLLAVSATHARAAEDCFQQALALARRQQAKSLELRACMSLGRLGQQQGRQAEVRPLLAEVYGWFTEGLQSPDLRQARRLLEELA